MDDVKFEKKEGICKPTYGELQSEYGRMADRCEYAEKLNKSLERVIVEKDNTIESLTQEIDDLNAIIGERNTDVDNKMNIIHALTDANNELKKELAKANLNHTFGTMMDEATGVMTSYKDWLLKRDVKLDVAEDPSEFEAKAKEETRNKEVKSDDNGDTQ